MIVPAKAMDNLVLRLITPPSISSPTKNKNRVREQVKGEQDW